MELDLRQLMRVARRWWWLLLVVPLIAGAAAYSSSSRQTPLYRATARLQVNPAQTAAGSSDYNAIQGSKSLAETYRQLITIRPVLEPVVSSLHLPYGVDMLQSKVSAATVGDTYLMTLSVSDPDPAQAAAIANAIAQRFQDYTVEQAQTQSGPYRKALDDQIAATKRQIAGLEQQIQQLDQGPKASDPAAQAQITSLRSSLNQQQLALNQLTESASQFDLTAAAAQTRVTVSETAVPPTVPYAPRTKFTTLLAAFAGLLLAGGAVFLLEYLDNTVKATSDFAALAGGPLLAAVGTVPKLASGRDQLFLHSHPQANAAEAVRLLRTNLEFAAAAREITTLAVTSPGPGEGKSTITANLGLAMAQAGFSTAIVDADLRRPSQHRIFDVGNIRGLTTLITHPQQSWRWAASEVAPGLWLIPSGPLPPNPADLLSLDRLTRLLSEIGAEVDIILLDTPPLLAVSDPLVVATHVDGVAVVCRAGQTRLEALQRAAGTLLQGGVRVVGVVLNQQRGRGEDAYYYYSKYYGSDNTPRGGAPAAASGATSATAPGNQPSR